MDDNYDSENLVNTATGKPRGKVTVSLLAEMSGVSRATVSRVLNEHESVNEEARAKVLAAIKATGYSKHRTQIKISLRFTKVTIMCDEHGSAFEGSYFDTVLRCLHEEGQRLGIQCEFIGRDQMSVPSRLSAILAGSEAIIVLGSDSPEILHIIKRFKMPTVLINGIDPSMKICTISPDAEISFYNIANYLMDHGHQRVALLTAHVKHTMWERTSGFVRAFKLRGIPFDMNRQVIDLCDIANVADPSGQTLELLQTRRYGTDFCAARLLPYLIDHSYFDGYSAVACICDSTAMSLIRALKERGISVPHDISVTGYDDISLASMMTPALTTVNPDYKNLAKAAFNNLIRIAGGSVPMIIRANTATSIIERGSVATIRRASPSVHPKAFEVEQDAI
ncbi:MAG: LacI family DNA-binding transcriptional regulator [Anaerobiospirillum succiniciproducens]|uniref:LacI family DNA-binding transcriptional regulator n=1 Tax=Anaerobiospirillum succiniciproducens TaxID=13335 RepID=UPI002A7587A2|nr:LacI family DNA-binding transcriptional regulator [Anaerobiospirillum succiniciproducens]MDY2799068.1 LacI family DNA-binding transcriptional regulator [Anaerobiospirillum succiniciproducens]